MKTITHINKGFTLAEVLITLGIIGVIAALTIPALITNMQDQHLRVAMKQKVSVFAQAFTILRANNGSTLVGVFEQGNVNSIFYNMKKPLNIISSSLTVTNGPNKDWLDYCDYKYLNGDPGDSIYKCIGCSSYTMADGSMFMPILGWTNNNINTCEQTGSYPRSGLCFDIVFDVNGKKGPNTMGKDIFLLSVYKDKTVPADYKYYVGPIDEFSCISTGTGEGCAIKYMMQ